MGSWNISVNGNSSNFIDVNGVRLHYLEWESAGRPILVVHGNGHAGGVYAPLAERLAPEFRVLTLDLRGHGLSERPGSYTWASFRDDVTSLVDALDLRDLLIVAHSRGGGVSLLTAAARTQRVVGVLAYEPTIPNSSMQGRLPSLVERTLNRRTTWPSRRAMYEHFRHRGAFQGWQDAFLHAYTQHCAVEREDGQVELASPVSVEASLYESMLDGTEWAKIDNCPLPVLAVFGERSQRLREGQDPMDVLRRYFPNATMKLQPDSTHSGIMEHPQLFEATVREFAAGLKIDNG